MTDWSDLKFFLELSRGGTLAAAARKLGVDNTTVGRRLAALERDLGAKLLARTPDGTTLTAAGEAIRAAAEQMEQAVYRAEQQALGADRKLSGLVRIATTEMLGEFVVLPALRVLHEKHPQIRIELITGTAKLDLARREADVALRYTRPESGDLIVHRAGTVAFAAYASKEYLAARGRPERGDGFAGHDLIAFDTGPRAFRKGGELGGEPVREGRFVMRTNSVLMMLHAVQQGLGIGPFPCVLAEGQPELVRIFDAPPEMDELWLLVHPDVHQTGRVRALLDAIEARLRELDARLRQAQS
ncbi:MAG TPA: LysR family transcriptional regulator [Myxococcales bacterium]|nr:LysR family transcriptional regulator [Myxococcales bacterium]